MKDVSIKQFNKIKKLGTKMNRNPWKRGKKEGKHKQRRSKSKKREKANKIVCRGLVNKKKFF